MALQKLVHSPLGEALIHILQLGGARCRIASMEALLGSCITGPPRPGYGKEPLSLSEAVVHLG